MVYQRLGTYIALAALLGGCASVQAANLRPPLEDEVVWGDYDHTSATFISERALNAYDPADLPVTLGLRDEIPDLGKYTLAGPKEVYQGKPAECWSSPRPEPAGSHPSSTDLAGLVHRIDLAFIARVERVDSGLNIPLGVSHRVFVRIERVLKGDLNAGDSISYIKVGGSILLRGRKVCQYPKDGFFAENPGVEILVLATEYGEDTRVVSEQATFPVHRNLIESQPYSALRQDVKKISVDSLIAAISQQDAPP